MVLTLKELTKDINSVDIDDILSCWHWIIGDMKEVHTISCLGDIFFIGKDNGIYWLQCDCGELIKIADSSDEFQELLHEEENYDEWLLPQLVEELISEGKILQNNQVYSYKVMPIIGGEVSTENIEPTDISIHFAFCGQICEQVKDLPEGAKINIVLKK